MRLRNLIPTETKLNLFKAVILPHLTYCHLVWHFCRASDTPRVERVYRSVDCALYLKTSSLVVPTAKLATLYNRRLQDICILMYKVNIICVRGLFETCF